MAYSKLTVDLSESFPKNSSEIIIGKGALNDSADMLASRMDADTHLHIVFDEAVSRLYSDRLIEMLKKRFHTVSQTVLPCGEAAKSLETLRLLWSDFAQNELTKDSCVISFGGGVVSDVAGFAASTYLRGIRCIHMPTTLLAMVDAAIGGKTTIDLPSGKNQAGTFYQPSLVIADTSLLMTLSEQNVQEGFAEIIKCSVMSDSKLFYTLLNDSSLIGDFRITDKNADWLTDIVVRCADLKRALVEQDPFDMLDIRMKLNLGHTFGHAIEAASDYALPHGQCVAIGLCMIGRISHRMHWCTKETADAIETCVTAYALPTTSAYPAEKLLPYIKRDKKRTKSTVKIIVPESIGRVSIKSVPVHTLSELLALESGEHKL